jgi:phosphatidylglycerol:prolipoprotein diacylglycerol transferase
MAGQGFVHDIDSVICRFGAIHLYYYGLAYSVGFLGVYIWLRIRRNALGWRVSDVYDFSILAALCVLLFGRVFSVLVYHWDYYAGHPAQIFNYWRGGMATHGVLLGGVISMFFFSRLRGVSFLRLTDEIAIPAAFLLVLGRIGNFINGQIVGTPTDLPWGVKFPGVEGFRHPVTLYEALKNLALIPILLVVRRRCPPGKGMVTAQFIFWYGFLRIFTDLFRDHPGEIFGIGGSQYFNALMVVSGLIMMPVLRRRKRKEGSEKLVEPAQDVQWAISESASLSTAGEGRAPFWLRRIGFALILLFSLTIRSAWTPEELDRRRATQHPAPPEASSLLPPPRG